MAALAIYGWVIRPRGSELGYSGDMCSDIVRQVMSENLARTGQILFHSDQFMAPVGASMPFMSWSIERDWLGAYFWSWNPDFPYRWAFYGFSLLLTYLGVGWLLGRMALGRSARWLAALFAVLLHVPRHYKTWHHYEHLPQHWVYLSFFLDAWIWKRLVREGRFSWTLELWRVFLQLGAFTSTGYFWGITSFEWMVVRGCLLAAFWLDPAWIRLHGRLQIERFTRRAAWPLLLCGALIACEVPWFYALYQEAHLAPPAYSNLAWFATPLLIFMPLWRPEWLHARWLPVLDKPETLVTIGWYFLIPLILAGLAIRRRRGGPGYAIWLPFSLFSFFGVLYIADAFPSALQSILPFMSFFRVASRWGLFFPELAAVMIALGWPELTSWFRAARAKPWGRYALLAFLVSCAFEVTWLARPVNAQPPLPAAAVHLLEGVRDAPGTTVLDLPFCVAGGNGLCTAEQCPQYPQSSAGLCMRQWHRKKVYGLYHPRMLPNQCEVYHREPYTAWFKAWQEDRCFSKADWAQFCPYLSEHPELSAVLVYPGIWKAAAAPACLASFTSHLGEPLEEATITAGATPTGGTGLTTQLLRFASRCIQKEE